MQDCLICNPTDLSDTKWGLTCDVLQEAGRRRLASKSWPPATAKRQMLPDMRRRELAMVQLNPQGVLGVPDMKAGSSAHSTVVERAPKGASRVLGFEEDEVAAGGPRRKMAKVEGRTSCGAAI